MTRRKGIQKVERWTTSDGQEFTSVKDANNHQGAITQLEQFFESFIVSEHVPPSDVISAATMQSVLYAWELHKAATDPATLTLLPEDGVSGDQSEQATEPAIEQATERTKARAKAKEA